MDEEQILKIAQEFDLNVYETKVWLSLLNKKVLTATEISEYSGVPRSRTYDVLENLEKKGFIAVKPGRPLKYFAFPPQMVVERLKIETTNELKEKLEFVEKLKQSKFLKQLNNIYENKQDIINVSKIGEHLTNLDLYEKIRDMLKETHESIRIVCDVDTLYRIVDNSGGALYVAIKRNVNLKVIAVGQPDITLNKFFGKDNVRYTDELKIKMMIFDSNATIFLLNEHDVGFWTNSMFVGKEFAKLFDFIWDKIKEKEEKQKALLMQQSKKQQ